MNLQVADKDSMIIGKVQARVGLVTQAGKISRFTEKTIWCIGKKSGLEHMYRKCDGPLPSVSRHFAGKAFEAYT